jgi:hypothetical protein
LDEKTRSITVPVVVPASINFDLALANSNSDIVVQAAETIKRVNSLQRSGRT